MHALALLSLVASTALVAAQDEFASFQPLSTEFLGTLQARQQQQQSCASVGGKTCGAKCIRLSYTCCGNGAGACEAGYTCGLAANGIYGCCPLGKRCRGDAPDPSTTDIGVARPTTVGAGAGDVGGGGDGDETTATRAVESTTTRRPTPTSTPARTTAVVSDDATISSSSTTSRSASTTTRSSVVASGTSGSSVNGAGSDSNSNGNGSGSGSGNNSNGSGSSSTTAGSGGNASRVSSAGNISVGLASLAGGFIAAIASLL
ncbi:hypothetical protein MY4824_004949 [Beauveria thailandica]